MHLLLFLFLLFTAIDTFARDTPLVSAEPSLLFKIQPDLSRQPDMKKISREIFPSMFNWYVTMLIVTEATMFLLYQ